jgi:hypothetical protein
MNPIRFIFCLLAFYFPFVMSSVVLAKPSALEFEQLAQVLVRVSSSSVAWGDYDGDGDLDILLTGTNSSSVAISKIYRNDSGAFTDIAAGLAGVSSSSSAWGDYDGDGDLDILLMGQGSSGRVGSIYRNDGGTFTDIGAGLEGVIGSSVWGDYDGDGDLDILLIGLNSVNQRISRIYRNDLGVWICYKKLDNMLSLF